MPEYLTPGLYLEETKEAPSIPGVSTATGAFVGVTQKGPFGSRLVTSFKEFVDVYGGFIEASYLAYAVKGFFDNGGTRAYISRTVHYATGTPTSASATKNLTDGTSAVAATFDASSHGSHGNDIQIQILEWSAADKTFSLVVSFKGVEVERYTTLKLSALEDAMNPYSNFVKVSVIDEAANISNQTLSLAGGNDGLVGLTGQDYIGDEVAKTGIFSFENDPINMLAVPGATDTYVLSALQAYAAKRRVFVITETPSAKTPSAARDFRLQTANLNSGRIGMFYPWAKVSDPIGVGSNPQKTIPPSGHIMGVFARTDASRGVFKAPAGESDGILLGVTSLEYNLNDNEQAILNPIGVNCLRTLPGAGNVVWGARTQAPAGDVFMFIPARRSVDFIEDSILSATRWAAFEVNDEVLYGKLKSSVESFLRNFWRSGGLKGKQENEAFLVKCDATTTSADDVKNGRVFVEIAVATQKPAEFIVFRVQVR